MKRLFALALLAGIVTAGLSCGDSTGAGPGQFRVRLTSPSATLDSAIVFTISGPSALTSVTAGTGLRVFQQPLGGKSTRFALVGPLPNGTTIVMIGVRDINELSQYTGTIEGVAMANYQLRTLPGGYALAISR